MRLNGLGQTAWDVEPSYDEALAYLEKPTEGSAVVQPQQPSQPWTKGASELIGAITSGTAALTTAGAQTYAMLKAPEEYAEAQKLAAQQRLVAQQQSAMTVAQRAAMLQEQEKTKRMKYLGGGVALLAVAAILIVALRK